MKSLREIYRIGNGPSSSHTMGVAAAAEIFRERTAGADAYQVTLYGSLASTGEGHCTDKVLLETLAPVPTRIFFDTESPTPYHPNTLDIIAFSNKQVIASQRFYSVGGGAVEIEGENASNKGGKDIYTLRTFDAIKKYCAKTNKRLWEYVYEVEGCEIKEYLNQVWQQMKNTLAAGLKGTGVLPGPLGLRREAAQIYNKVVKNESPTVFENRMLCAYAFAVAEENAAGGRTVTAPTCGACGVLPAVLFYKQQYRGFTDDEVVNALATAGLIGNIIKTNATISGAEGGCQAEIGSACSMAAAANSELYKQDLKQIEYAAEIAMEHHLGLTCDPICGLVQIPCIERNAIAALRAIDASRLAFFLSESRKISFDLVVKTMYETGKDMNDHYKETSKGGLAKLYNIPDADKHIGKIT